MVTLYGISNCDTMKKARAWLAEHHVAHVFHDYKREGISTALLQTWAGQVGWQSLLNRAGTTFRKLPDSARENLTGPRAIALMVRQPSLIKRPVLDVGGRLTLGFTPDTYRALFKG